MRYMQLSAENSRLSSEISQLQAQLENVNARVAEAEADLSRDSLREEGQQLEAQVCVCVDLCSRVSAWWTYLVVRGRVWLSVCGHGACCAVVAVCILLGLSEGMRVECVECVARRVYDTWE